MSKIMVVPKSKQMITELLNEVDAFVIGIEGLSINLPFYNSFEQAKQIIECLNQNNKEIFVSLNKNIFNKDLKYLEETLINLNELNITGIMFYDVSVVNIIDKLKLDLQLVWSQEHFTTNYDTINYWYELGVKYTLISSEITYDEIMEIRKNTQSKLIVPVFGHLPMFTSARHLVKNYLNFFDKEKKVEQYYMQKEGKKYPVIDNDDGTFVYSANVLNAIEESIEFKNNNIEYLMLNSFNIDTDKFVEIVKMFKNNNEINKLEYDSKINQLIKNNDKGFLYKETVYKVKNNE